MKHLWQLPAALQHLVEKRWGPEKRVSERRRGMSLLYRIFGGRDRRQSDRRVTNRRRDDRDVASVDHTPPTARTDR